MEALDSKTDELKYVVFYHITSDGDLYYGQIFKQRKDISFADYTSALEHVSDEGVYPLVPEGIMLKIAPNHWDRTTAPTKRPGLTCYKAMKGTEFIPKQILQGKLLWSSSPKPPTPTLSHTSAVK
ncbi:hypothetical protein RRF57_004934 [Xylaria bambusicola]|uniref:Uncharacterized protein n=1 Tax=Xylaria bambusicola TaxID=326684 RepID=A0AAN7UP13_9PEZI